MRLFSHEAVELSEAFHIIEVETVPLHSIPGCFVPERERRGREEGREEGREGGREEGREGGREGGEREGGREGRREGGGEVMKGTSLLAHKIPFSWQHPHPLPIHNTHVLTPTPPLPSSLTYLLLT